MRAGECRSCGAMILFAVTERGKYMPLDEKPVEFGGNIVLREGLAHVLAKGEPSNQGEARYRTHFQTCKRAAAHRKRVAARKAKKAEAEKPKPPTLF